MTDPRALAKAAGAAQRLAAPLAALVRLAEPLPLTIQVQANAVLEELDLLRHYLREALLTAAIDQETAPAIPPELALALADWAGRVLADRLARPARRGAKARKKPRSGSGKRGRKGDRAATGTPEPEPNPLN